MEEILKKIPKEWEREKGFSGFKLIYHPEKCVWSCGYDRNPKNQHFSSYGKTFNEALDKFFNVVLPKLRSK